MVKFMTNPASSISFSFSLFQNVLSQVLKRLVETENLLIASVRVRGSRLYERYQRVVELKSALLALLCD